MNKKWRIILLIVTVIVTIVVINRSLASAWMMELRKWELEELNPTEYVFDFSREEVKQAVWRRLGKGEYRGMDVSGFGEWSNNEFFTFRGLHNLRSFTYRKSADRGRNIWLEMRVYLDSLAPRQTRVWVETTLHEVFTGFGFCKGRMSIFGPLTKKLPPTTIEQYQVLYKIGKELGVKMPRVKYPKGLNDSQLKTTYYNPSRYNQDCFLLYDGFDG